MPKIVVYTNDTPEQIQAKAEEMDEKERRSRYPQRLKRWKDDERYYDGEGE